jgi:hypothetical protein
MSMHKISQILIKSTKIRNFANLNAVDIFRKMGQKKQEDSPGQRRKSCRKMGWMETAGGETSVTGESRAAVSAREFQ